MLLIKAANIMLHKQFFVWCLASLNRFKKFGVTRHVSTQYCGEMPWFTSYSYSLRTVSECLSQLSKFFD